jgi:putative ABC transport system permease protein
LTLRQLALSNLGSMRRKYAAFFFSSILAVTVFYLIASFVFHPDVSSGYVAQADRVRRGLLVAECMIIVFSFFFVLYSSSVFVRSRKKEFGLLSLLGATKSQLSGMVIIEHVAIGATSVAVGVGLGIPLSRYLLIAICNMLRVTSPVRFMIVVPAAALTAILFMMLFTGAGAFTSLCISPRKVVKLLREHQMPKALPGYSRFVALSSLLCIGAGYAVAWKVTGYHLIRAMLPVTAIVSLGTFLFFAQSSVGILRILQNRVSFLYRNLNLLTIGDLVFRMKENAWVLASVAVLSAAVITATGTIYTAQATLLGDQERAYPHAMTFAVSEEADPQILSHNIREILQECQISVQEEVVLPGLWVQADGYGRALIVREHIFNRWATDAGRKEVSLEGTEAAMLLPFMDSAGEIGANRFPMDVSLGSKTVTVEAHPWSFARTNCLSEIQQLIVVDDAIFEVLATESSSEDRINFFSYEFVNWQEAIEAGKRVLSLASDAGLIESASRLDSYEVRKQTNSLTAMIALFIASLFFIASGSLLYFRLFNEIREDREKYRMMEKLGVSRQEIRRVVTRQLLVFFFAPTVMGSVHCSFAMKALSNVLKEMPWPFVGVFKYGVAAVGGFSIIQVVYFLAARHAYSREILDMTTT